MPTIRLLTTIGALLAGLSVALGAFGSHALGTMVTARRLDTWDTAVHYQMIHAIALLWLGFYIQQNSGTRLHTPAMLLLTGTLVFSGSLFALVLTDITLLGAITPLGGVLLISGWISLAWQLARGR